MKNKKLLIALVSVFLVVLFSMPAYAWWGRPEKKALAPVRQKIMRRIGRKLNLTDEQKEIFKTNAEKMEKERKADQEALEKIHQKLKAEIRKDDPSRNAVNRIIKEIGSWQTKMMVKRLNLVLDLRETLTPEQKDKFEGMLGKFEEKALASGGNASIMRAMKRIAGIGLVLLLMCSASMALTWEEGLALAEENNNELISAQKQFESYEWTYRQAFSAFLPQLSASAGLTETGTPTMAASSRSYSYGLSVTQNLFQGMQSIYNIQSAYADLEYQRANLISARADVFYDLRSAFIELAVLQEKVKLYEDILAKRKNNSRLIQLRYESGREDKGNLMATKAEEAQALHDLFSAKRNIKLARLKLSQMLDYDVFKVNAEMELIPEFFPDFDQLIVLTPSYIMAESNLKSAELAQKATISGFLPSISLNGQYSNKGSDWPPDSAGTSWNLNFNYSFFPGGSNFAQRAIYGAKLDQARQEHAQSIKYLRYGLERAYEEFSISLSDVEVKKVSLEAARERARIAHAKYLKGLLIYDEWNRIENKYILAQKDLLSKERSALIAQADWYKSYGGYIK